MNLWIVIKSLLLIVIMRSLASWRMGHMTPWYLRNLLVLLLIIWLELRIWNSTLIVRVYACINCCIMWLSIASFFFFEILASNYRSWWWHLNVSLILLLILGRHHWRLLHNWRLSDIYGWWIIRIEISKLLLELRTLDLSHQLFRYGWTSSCTVFPYFS